MGHIIWSLKLNNRYRSLGSCVHVASVLLGMGVDPEERSSYTINESVALTSENFLDWEDSDSSEESANSQPASPASRPAKRSRNVEE